jgi:acyl-ACP thioesterase
VSVDLVPEPSNGRVFSSAGRVRLGDSSPGGRQRLDALTRVLQDVSDDDTRDAGYPDDAGWVVRRTSLDVVSFPTYLEPFTLHTWCSGTGGRWAERRISLRGERGGHIETATLWVHMDPVRMRPAPLPPEFHVLFGEATGGRHVRASLHHDDAPVDGVGVRWPLRFTDFDVLGHVNNSNYWAIVEQHLVRRRDLRAPMRAEVEHRDAIEPGAEVDVVARDGEGTLDLWVLDAASGKTYASASVRVTP